ncbi:MAG TPA: ATP-binding cassette domain-containing protein [Hyphomicrobiaceae bacterium]|nr:ATP-binding cassette domain-containing protein [Hyphomicrobiaceae bacterium]
MRTSRRMLKQARGALIKAFVFSGLINVLMMATPLYTLQVFETVVPLGSIETLVIITAITALALATLACLEIVRDLILARAGGWLDQEMGEFILENGLKAGQPGSELRQDIRALETLRGFIASPAVAPFFDGPWVPIFLIALALLHPLIGVLGAVSVAALFIVSLLQAGLTERLHRESLEARERSSQWWGLATSNATLVAALGLAEGVARRWGMSNRSQVAGNYSMLKRMSFVKSLARLVRLGAQIAIYALGAWLVIADQVTPGVLVASAILLARALAPMEQLVGAIKPAIGAWRAYQRLKAMPDAVRAVKIADDNDRPTGHLSLKNVTVYLPGRKLPALREASLEIAPGTCVALVGPNGAGKSTFASVIAGAIVPSIGSADLDGVPVHRWQRSGGAPRIGYMGDDPMLADGTVHENIVRFSDQSLMTAAQAGLHAGVHERLQELPHGYETEVGALGRALSFSERRAVALARAVVSSPRILVLDEPEAGLDGAGMRELVHALEKMKADGVSLIITTQDPRLLGLMDKVLILSGGMIQSVKSPMEIAKTRGGDASPRPAKTPEVSEAERAPLRVAAIAGGRA